ncbi:hypothetical protein XENORESO_005770 [Xenotaenia resolanae]|uniref:Uncharacterized protein n=1 Tax=Xenotaenia resolanae TaxID=208358 RepID=A0ABV0WRB9_9TELE
MYLNANLSFHIYCISISDIPYREAGCLYMPGQFGSAVPRPKKHKERCRVADSTPQHHCHVPQCGPSPVISPPSHLHKPLSARPSITKEEKPHSPTRQSGQNSVES